jgi:VanZ family protein
MSELHVLLAALLALAGACLVPNRWLPAAMPNDKLMHFLAFGALTLLTLHMAPDARQAPLWLGGLMLAGWLIECLQQLVPDRDFSWPDIAANGAGIATAALAFFAHGAI